MNQPAQTMHRARKIALTACLSVGVWLAASAAVFAQQSAGPVPPRTPVPVPPPVPIVAPGVEPPLVPPAGVPADASVPRPATLMTSIGRIVRVEDEEDRITVTLTDQGRDGTRQVTVSVPDDAEIILNGRPARLDDLLPGDIVRMITHRAEPTVAETVIAARAMVGADGVRPEDLDIVPRPRGRRARAAETEVVGGIAPHQLFTPRGGRLFVNVLQPNSAEFQAGLRAGDTVVVVGPQQILPVAPLVPGAAVNGVDSIIIQQDGTLTFPGQQQQPGVGAQQQPGVGVQQQPGLQQQQVGFQQTGFGLGPQGLYVPRPGRVFTALVQADTPAFRAGLQPGDTILFVAVEEILPSNFTDAATRQTMQPTGMEAGVLITPGGRLTAPTAAPQPGVGVGVPGVLQPGVGVGVPGVLQPGIVPPGLGQPLVPQQPVPGDPAQPVPDDPAPQEPPDGVQPFDAAPGTGAAGPQGPGI